MKRDARLLDIDASKKIAATEIPGIQIDLLTSAQGCSGYRVVASVGLRDRLRNALLMPGSSLIEVLLA